ncbi:MAG: uroporphyrinogen decarboxylase family protein [Desulfobacterales bacterium]
MALLASKVNELILFLEYWEGYRAPMQLNFKKDYSSFQIGARRMEAAMGGIPDRVPVCAQMHEFVMAELGVNAKEFYTTSRYLPAGTLEIMEKYGIDVPLLDYDVYNIEAEALGQQIIYNDSHMPDIDRSKPLIRDRHDLLKIQTPEFESQGRFSNVIEMQAIFRNLSGTEPVLGFCAPFSLAANLMGIEKLILAIDGDSDFIRDLLDRLIEKVLMPWIDYQRKKFPNSKNIAGSDATASLPIVSPELLQKWIVPYILRLREFCGPGVYVPNWVGESHLKNPEEMFSLKLQVCPGFLEGQDPDVAEIGPAVYKAYAEKQGVPLILGIGAGFMDLRTPDEVAKRVRQYIEVGGINGRFALYLCNLSAATPPANVRAAIDAVQRYGTYRQYLR